MEKIGTSNKPQSKGSIGKPASKGTDVITSYSCDFDKSLCL